ncbi:chemotaxis protein CheD [Halorubrum sp. HHNYT27]|uniref:chemotaxis protein CheD n=1 Tax=Halorubrum sp. HHNYT27 TaxID=3402275 RepID=UPI003EB6B8EE
MSHSSSSRDSGSRDRGESDGDAETTGDDAAARRIKVGVSDLAVAADGETLTTSGLGSCVAVALVDDRAGVRGLLHAMLPASDEARTTGPRAGKYVDAGIDELIGRLVTAGAAPGRLEARVAGGAEMLDLTDAVGPRNVEQVERCLSAAGIPIVASDVGDGVGRTVRFVAGGGLVVRAADGFERTL